ncbi:MAG: (4Fe-4S)-binding protein [Spirochaetae bacterium HGW-Spirochaetae-3]|jgi:MinD superfamily P-loop ATPase|nr:MAG: (4Fe-4S)-binding protein [Spirochaetae bacterium HGW-Spirochaetae-3]
MNEAGTTVIAVASGKGGTGKTTVAAHLAIAGARTMPTVLVDLDVEAPDATGYFKDARPSGAAEEVSVLVPRLLEARCTGCGLCARTCRFGAILAIGGVMTIDQKACKGCGACVAACPTAALEETPMTVGATSISDAGGLSLLEGRMVVGDIRSTVVIEATKKRAAASYASLSVRDCPPGVSCPATHAIEGADYIVLVAEPTEFSIHDLKAAIGLANGRGIPAGVVINKDGFGDADIAGFCEREGIPVIGRIAFKRERAASGAAASLWRGDPAITEEIDTILARALAGARRGTLR